MSATRGRAPARATGKFTWRMLATVLAGQSLVIFFGALVARGLAGGDDAPAGLSPFALMCALAVACVVVAGMVKRPLGVGLGLLVQVLTLLSAIWVPMMLAIGLIFGGLYLYCLRKGVAIDAQMAARGDG